MDKELNILSEASGLTKEKAQQLLQKQSWKEDRQDDDDDDEGTKPPLLIITRKTPSTRRSKSARRICASSGHHQHHTKHFVEHNYHDHSHDPIVLVGDASPAAEEEEEAPIANRSSSKIKQSRRGHRGGVSTPFPEKLHEMLTAIDEDGGEDTNVVSWQPHGRCFIVRDPKAFVEDVMPQ
jgi:hypothetical protein